MLRYTIISILSFVDNFNFSNPGRKYETVYAILRQTTSYSQLWNDLILESGGAFESKNALSK